MSTNSVNLILILCLCFSVLLFTLGCILNIADGLSLEPVRRLRITIDESQREDLFAQFQKFAEKHGFEIQITDYGNRGEYFQVWMTHDNIQIISENAPGDARLFDVGFYGLYPGYPVDEEVVDELLNDLKSFISEIPNVTITEER